MTTKELIHLVTFIRILSNHSFKKLVQYVTKKSVFLIKLLSLITLS